MAEIIHFSPRKEWDAISNLAGFIRICREDLTVFGADLDWDNDVWKAAGVSFGNLDQRVRRFRPENVMQSPFKEFAKAYLRYEQGLKPTKNQVGLQALKCIERALVETRGAVDVESLTLAVFDRAAVVASTHFSRHAAYQVGGRLAAIAKFLSEKRLVSRVLDWKNPLKFPGFMQVRTGAKAREERIQQTNEMFSQPQQSACYFALHHELPKSWSFLKIVRFGKPRRMEVRHMDGVSVRRRGHRHLSSGFLRQWWKWRRNPYADSVGSQRREGELQPGMKAILKDFTDITHVQMSPRTHRSVFGRQHKLLESLVIPGTEKPCS
jgi:hypothetical protein